MLFNLDEDNKPIVESFTEDTIDGRLFSSQYRCSLEQIEQYLLENGSGVGHSSYSETDGANNIFAFIGSRGSGKTSCMLSVSKSLSDTNYRSTFRSYPTVANRNFVPLELIDPTYFDKDHNLLSLFIARLYKHFEDKASNPVNFATDIQDKLLAKFSEAQRFMNFMLEAPKYSPENTLENLAALSAAIDLRNSIHDLVDLFLEYFCVKDGVLLLKIDDVDLNPSEATKMAEIIRKYFIQDNIIVFFAVKLDQMEKLKFSEFKKEYAAEIDVNELSEMTERYFSKLIPQSHRIYMPDAEVYLKESLELTSRMWNTGRRKQYKFPTIRQGVPQLIFWKTRYLFYNTETTASYIVPRNLRELRQLLKLVAFMPEVNGSRTTKLLNQRLFRKYFYESWTLNNLDEAGRRSFAAILRSTDDSQINYTILSNLRERFPNQIDGSNNKEIKNIYNAANNKFNLSTGDVLGMIMHLSHQTADDYDLKYLFILSSYYSFLLYEAYNKLTDGNEQQNINEGHDSEIFKDNSLRGLSDYSRLTGGSIINTRLTSVMPDMLRVIKPYARLNIAEMKSMMGNCVDKSGKAINIERIRLIELLMLGTYYNVDKEDSTEDSYYRSTYRTDDTVVYASHIKSDYAMFDLGSLLFNLTRIEDAYMRFSKVNKVFVDYVLNKHHKDTLYSQLRQLTIKDKQSGVGSFDINRWLSYCAFRNTEVLQDFSHYLGQNEYSGFTDFESLNFFFTHAADFSANSYDLDENGNPYKINFKFIKLFEEVLKEDLKEDFEKIYGVHTRQDESKIEKINA